MSKKLTEETVRNHGNLVGYFEGDDVYRFHGIFFALADGEVIRVNKNDISFEFEEWPDLAYLIAERWG